ncbi:MAG: helix-turn-helix domain-containing protein [Bacteroidota bacterium]|nr:helix-turn-helix domain-containing protein [Bacteroidota bacterium]MDP4230897.1 helix-turn-helix domain-containing protein [Bacteroidota bacterium]MDP4237052.1 helix-turn-helix domain-containing protein [Bacteroidota bacterium]
MKPQKDILMIDTLAKFERVINLDDKPYDINMMVMPGTLEDKHKNATSIPALRRQFNLLYLLLSGEHDVKLNSEHRQLQSNDLVIVPENMLYASDHIHNCKGYCIHFKTEFIQPLLSGPVAAEFPFLEFDSEHIVNITEEESLLVQQAFKDILAEYQRFSHEKDFVLRNYILILLHRVREIYQRNIKRSNQNKSRSEQLATQFKHLVEKHFTEQRNVWAYAKMMNISPRHLSDVVSSTTGRSPLEIIHDILFLEAKALLRSTDKTITEIAHQLRFDDQSHFSHFIKKRTGATPVELRKTL